MKLFAIEIRTLENVDRQGESIRADARDLGLSDDISVTSAHGYLLQGDLSEQQLHLLARELLVDLVTENYTLHIIKGPFDPIAELGSINPAKNVYVLPKPGVTDPVAESAMKAIADFGIEVQAVRTYKKYEITGTDDAGIKKLCSKLLANDAIEQVILNRLRLDGLDLGNDYLFELTTVPIRLMNDEQLMGLSKKGQLRKIQLSFFVDGTQQKRTTVSFSARDENDSGTIHQRRTRSDRHRTGNNCPNMERTLQSQNAGRSHPVQWPGRRTPFREHAQGNHLCRNADDSQKRR